MDINGILCVVLIILFSVLCFLYRVILANRSLWEAIEIYKGTIKTMEKTICSQEKTIIYSLQTLRIISPSSHARFLKITKDEKGDEQ
jgi:hypothetical protein